LGLCYLCGEEMHFHSFSDENVNGWTREHVEPRSRGGSRVLLAHINCNLKKGNRRATQKELDYAAAMYRLVNVLEVMKRWNREDELNLMESLTCKHVHSFLQGLLTGRYAESLTLLLQLDSLRHARNGRYRPSRKR